MKNRVKSIFRNSVFSVTLLLLSFLVSNTVLVAEEALFIAAASAPVMEKASRRGKKVNHLKMGDQLKIIKKKGLWYQVSNAAKPGWIHKMFVSSTNPNKNSKGYIAVFQKVAGTLKADTPRRRSTVMGVRGLDEEGDLKNTSVEPDLAAVNQIDRNYKKLSDKTLDAFLAAINSQQ